MAETGPEAAAERAATVMRRGDLIAAYDAAAAGLATAPDDLRLRYLAVLALARSGATRLAAERFSALGLDRVTEAPGKLAVDIPALNGRITKDMALAAEGEEQAALFTRAADLYLGIFERTGDPYPGINAAALHLWAGDRDRARALAHAVLDHLGEGADDYWSLATRAEALLLAGEPEAAADVLAATRLRESGTAPDWQAVASTRRQLRRHCRALGYPTAVLDALAPPRVLVFSGHMIGPRMRAADVPAVTRSIATLVATEKIVAGYGSLAGGADILFAEALIARGAELHVVLPFDKDDFVRVSVAPSGDEWPARFEACLAQATSVRIASKDRYIGDDAPFEYAIRNAMGRAVLRARAMDSEAVMAAVWDGAVPQTIAGTAADVAIWQSLGRPLHIIRPSGAEAAAPEIAAEEEEPERAEGRQLAAILFGDIEGFSQIREAHLPAYVETVLGGMAKALDAHGGHILTRNTWGDAIFAVFDDPVAAARAAREIHLVMNRIGRATLEWPKGVRLRVAGHYGPVRKVFDPVQQKVAYMGVEVIRAARIEPVAAPGMTYVSEALAAALALRPDASFACDYLGEVDTAKGYDRLPLYLLRDKGPADE